MGYTTTLYYVDIEKLRSAVGSCDTSLQKQLIDLVDSEKELDSESLSQITADATVRITTNGEVLFNNHAKDVEQLCKAIKSMKNGVIEFIMEPGTETPWTLLHEEVVLATNKVIPQSGIDKVITRWHSNDPFVCNSPCVSWSRSEDKEFTPAFCVDEVYLKDIVFGRFSNEDPSSSYQYGYALEVLCHLIGTLFPDDDLLGDLEYLALNSLLQEPRIPVAIPEYPEFPVISYLTSEELIKEVDRLSSIDLSYPEDLDIQEARETLFKCLKQASEKNVGVVSFYYQDTGLF